MNDGNLRNLVKDARYGTWSVKVSWTDASGATREVRRSLETKDEAEAVARKPAALLALQPLLPAGWKPRQRETRVGRLTALRDSRNRRRLDALIRAKILCRSAGKRAAVRGLAFSLDEEEVASAIKAGTCAATGLSFDLTPDKKRCNPLAPSLDRVDPAAGYTRENTRVVIWAFNCMRNEFSDEVLETVFKAWLAKRCLKLPEEETFHDRTHHPELL